MATLEYDPVDGAILLVTDQGTLSFDGCGPGLEFSRQGRSGATEQALWLSADEAVVLGKMVRYCLGLDKLSPASRAVLEAVEPRLAALQAAASPRD